MELFQNFLTNQLTYISIYLICGSNIIFDNSELFVLLDVSQRPNKSVILGEVLKWLGHFESVILMHITSVLLNIIKYIHNKITPESFSLF